MSESHYVCFIGMENTRDGKTVNGYNKTLKRGNPASAQAQEVPMAYTLSSTCVAIADAILSDNLRVVECASKYFDEPYWSIEDQHGVIEVALSASEADARISAIRERVAQ